MNPKHLSLARRLRFILPGPLSTFNMTHIPVLFFALGGPQEKMSFFQIASGPILSIPFHLKVCQYDPCKCFAYEPPKVSVFLALVTGLVTDLDSLVTDPVLALALRNRMYLSGRLVM
jgi:hypothetical protein